MQNTLSEYTTNELLHVMGKINEELKKRVVEEPENSELEKEAIQELEALRKNNNYGFHLSKVEFVVNEEKRTVVCLVRGLFSNCVNYRGIAKCNPNDTFKASIGQVIALYRARGLEVPSKYLQ